MKTTLLLTLGAMIGSCLIASAQDAPKRPERPQRPLPPELLKEFDKDGDGKLSADEMKAMREARIAKMEEMKKEMLEKYDADKDGKLSEDERAKARADREAEMLKKFDTDGDGKLSDEEKAKMPKRPGGPGGPGGPDPHEFNAAMRYLNSPSTSAGSATVRATPARTTSPRRLRSRWTATFTAPSVSPSSAAS